MGLCKRNKLVHGKDLGWCLAYSMLLLLFIILNTIFFLFALLLETPALNAEAYAYYINIITATTNTSTLHLLLTNGVLSPV